MPMIKFNNLGLPALGLAIVMVAAGYYALMRSNSPLETKHYIVTSTASAAQTRQVAVAVESLHAAYVAHFALAGADGPVRPKYQLTLYKDRDEFRRHNKSAQWAEAYYLTPSCHAYFAASESNPSHWMIHEATHQLNNELAHFPSQKWINEGLASYFGASVIRDGKLIAGLIDPHTYPIWAVSRLSLSGDLKNDLAHGKIIGLRALLTGVGGPPIDEKFNAYYIGYWSLSHFLFHFEHGKYAQAYRKLIAAGGSVAQFERLIGPLAQVEAEWYGYLMQQAGALRNARAARAGKQSG